MFLWIYRWTESSKEQHLFKIEIFCNIINVKTVTFDQILCFDVKKQQLCSIVSPFLPLLEGVDLPLSELSSNTRRSWATSSLAVSSRCEGRSSGNVSCRLASESFWETSSAAGDGCVTLMVTESAWFSIWVGKLTLSLLTEGVMSDATLLVETTTWEGEELSGVTEGTRASLTGGVKSSRYEDVAPRNSPREREREEMVIKEHKGSCLLRQINSKVKLVRMLDTFC